MPSIYIHTCINIRYEVEGAEEWFLLVLVLEDEFFGLSYKVFKEQGDPLKNKSLW